MMHKTISHLVYDYIVQQPVGTHFTSSQLAHTLGFDVGPVSAALHRLENKCGMLKAIGRRGHAFTYECVNHKTLRFKRRGVEKKQQHRDSGGKHPRRDLPDMPDMNGSEVFLHPEPEPSTKKLSARLLRLGVILEQQRQLRRTAMRSGANVIPPRATKSMLDQILEIAWEIEVLEHKNAYLQARLDDFQIGKRVLS